MRKYDIPKPCSEKWENMTLQGSDRFCDVCQKTVYNFDKKNVEEIEKLVAQSPKICAKISSSLNFSKVLLLSVSLSVVSCKTNASNLPSKENIQSQEILIKGKIHKGFTKNVIGGAKIELYTFSKIYRTFSDNDGEFTLKIFSKDINKTLLFSVAPKSLFGDSLRNYEQALSVVYDRKSIGSPLEIKYLSYLRIGAVIISDKEVFNKYFVNGHKVSEKKFEEISNKGNGVWKVLEDKEHKKAVIGSSNFDDAYLYYTPEAIVIQESN